MIILISIRFHNRGMATLRNNIQTRRDYYLTYHFIGKDMHAFKSPHLKSGVCNSKLLQWRIGEIGNLRGDETTAFWRWSCGPRRRRNRWQPLVHTFTDHNGRTPEENCEGRAFISYAYYLPLCEWSCKQFSCPKVRSIVGQQLPWAIPKVLGIPKKSL